MLTNKERERKEKKKKEKEKENIQLAVWAPVVAPYSSKDMGKKEEHTPVLKSAAPSFSHSISLCLGE